MIPLKIHFIWYGKHKPLPETAELSLFSAVFNTKAQVILHTDNATLRYPGVETRLIEMPKEVNGKAVNVNNIPQYDGKYATHEASLTEILRCDILYNEGGIYSDLDVFWLRNPLEYLTKKVVIGFTNQGYKILCNAIIMSEKGNPALIDYKMWVLKKYPFKKYWEGANPWPIWKDNPDITFVKKAVWFPYKWNQDTPLNWDTCSSSVAVHLFASFRNTAQGEVPDCLRQLKDQLGWRVAAAN